MSAPGAIGEGRRSRSTHWLGYLFSVGCLVWVFYDLHPKAVLGAIRVAAWWYVVPAIAFDILTYILQGMRWAQLLKPVGRVRPMRATQAIYAGLFANELVPLRFGEILRAFLVSRWLGSRVARVVPSLAVERFLDAFWLAVGIGLAAILVPLPRRLVDASDVLGGLVLVAAALFAWVVWRKERELEQGTTREAPRSRLWMRCSAMLAFLAGGLREIGIGKNLLNAALLSVGMIFCQAVAVWLLMLAYGFRLPIVSGVVVFLIVRLGTAIPNAPANIGSFQLFTVLALGLFSVEKTAAAGFSIVDFAVLTVPLWILGLLALAKSGTSLKAIRAELARLRSRPLTD